MRGSVQAHTPTACMARDQDRGGKSGSGAYRCKIEFAADGLDEALHRRGATA
jgi:hypothetical protein